MKLIKVFSFLVLLGFLSCKSEREEIIISGEILGANLDNIKYTLPGNGTCFYGFTSKIEPDNEGKFELHFIINQPSIMQFYLTPQKKRVYLLLEKGNKYNVIFSPDDKDNFFNIKSSNIEGQKLLNQSISMQRSLYYNGSSNTENDFEKIQKDFNTKEKTEIDSFKKILEENKISNNFFKLVQNNIHCFYTMIKGKDAIGRFYKEQYSNNGIFSNQVQKMWKDCYKDSIVLQPSSMSSPWYYKLAQNYLNQVEYTHPEFNSDDIYNYFEKGIIHTHNIEYAKMQLPEPMLEYYTACYIYNQCEQRKFEKELISLYFNFEQNYPQSMYLPFIKEAIIPTKEYYKIDESSLTEKIFFSDSTLVFNTLKEITNQLKGEKLFVDIWATWCAPCVSEFDYNNELKKVLKSNNYKLVYISMDDIANTSSVKKVANLYDLKGYHVVANTNLQNNLHTILNNGNAFPIPRYLIIDKNGFITNNNASRPSDIKNLEVELSK